MSINLKILIPDDSTQLVWVRLAKANEELVKAFSATTTIITRYSALGVETVETI